MAWGSSRCKPNGRNLLNSIQSSALLIINTGSPTFVRRKVRGSVIDLSLVSERYHYEWVRSPDTQGSDHYPISLDPLGLSRDRTFTYRITDWSLFRTLCATPPPANTDFLTHISRCVVAATKWCTVPAGTPAPDIKLLKLRAARRRAERRAIKSDKVEHWTLYNRLYAACRRHARQRRNQSWQSLCLSLEDTRDKARPWRILAALLSRKIPRRPALSIAVARGLSAEQLAELFADAFAPPSVCPVKAAVELPPHNMVECIAPMRYFPTSAILEHVEVPCSAEFTLRELRIVLNRRQRRSAPGSDGVTHQVLRNMDAAQLPSLLEVFNSVWRSGIIPADWKEAIVVPILKRDKPASNITPIAQYR
ncbi:uncharacterized protein LOC142586226 [Dermacentor variabilis]|uniref:uncharacterized protein LOC142586226 n=1 Tax=Dermacentor variabilis TaxID=34621 RepID=UPI003F5B6E6F